MTYLQKIGLAFRTSKTEIDLNTIKGQRDTTYFEIYKLKQEYEDKKQDIKSDEIDANDLVWPDFFQNENEIKLPISMQTNETTPDNKDEDIESELSSEEDEGHNEEDDTDQLMDKKKSRITVSSIRSYEIKHKSLN